MCKGVAGGSWRTGVIRGLGGGKSNIRVGLLSNAGGNAPLRGYLGDASSG